MIRRIFLAIVLSIAFGINANAQNYREQFAKLFEENDVPRQYSLLQSWEKAAPEDPELYVCFFNHYFAKSRHETLSLTTAPPKGEGVALRKENDDKVAGYIGSNVTFTKTDFDAAIKYIDRGIEKFPDRLDMRFGKTYALGQIGDFKRFTDEIVMMIERSNVNKNIWMWKEGKPLEKPGEFMLGSIQAYVVQLFDSGNQQVKFIKPIADTILKYYPEHVESLSNLSAVCMINEDFDGALVRLLKAEKLSPGDFVVIGNIAYSYYKKHDRLNATKYYEKLSKIGDEQAKKDAAAILLEMNGWK